MMMSKLVKVIAPVAVIAGLSVGGWLAFGAGEGARGFFAGSQAPEAETWTIEVAETVTTFGKYAVVVDMARLTGERSLAFSPRDYENFCQIALEQIPAATDIAASDIYRVGIRVNLQDGTHTQKFLPVSVRDGQCHAVSRGGFYYTTYPAPLEQWVPYGLSWGPIGGGDMNIEAVFYWIGEGDAPLDTFDMSAACTALFSDPQYLMRDWTGFDDVTTVNIVAVAPTTPEPTTIGFEVTVSDQTCGAMRELT